MAMLLSDNSQIPIRVSIFRGTSKASPLYSVREFGNNCLLFRHHILELLRYAVPYGNYYKGYDIQKDVENHHFSRWTKISTPSIYRKVIQLNEKGYLQSDIVKGDKFADKAVYSITEKGRSYFEQLMNTYANEPVSLMFDFNVVITNLNKMEKGRALDLVGQLRESIVTSAKSNEGYAADYDDIPLVGRTIFEQQRLLFHSLLEWLDTFEEQFKES